MTWHRTAGSFAMGALLGALLLAAGAAPAAPLHTYTYTGNLLNGPDSPGAGASISGHFTVAAPLGADAYYGPLDVVSFSFQGGYATYTQDDTWVSYFEVWTDGTAGISDWYVQLMKGTDSTSNLLITANWADWSGSRSTYDQASHVNFDPARCEGIPDGSCDPWEPLYMENANVNRAGWWRWNRGRPIPGMCRNRGRRG